MRRGELYNRFYCTIAYVRMYVRMYEHSKVCVVDVCVGSTVGLLYQLRPP